VFIEANYDEELLRKNMNYPAHVKARIASKKGHLSNTDCARYITELVGKGATRLVLAHLSRENNTPRLAFEFVKDALASREMRLERDYTLDVAKETFTGNYISV